MKFVWWMPPVIGVGLAAIANGVLIATAVLVKPTKIEAHPYAASAFEDDRRGERDAFAARGWRLDTQVDGGGVTVRLSALDGPRPEAAVVKVYRPDDPALDRELVWTDPAQPLRIDLPRPGAWSLRLMVRDSAGATLAGAARLNRP